MMNKVQLLGNLGSDVELRKTSTSGKSVANFRMATNEQWTDSNGTRQKRTEWHRIVVWGPQAEACAKYLSSGRLVYLEGKIQTREWLDKDGTKRYTTEIHATDVKFLPSGQKQASVSQEVAPEENEAPVEQTSMRTQMQQEVADL